MDLDARLQLNTRVLRRIDPCAARILAAASFAVYYTYENEWTKTSVEGPLFLYQRTQAPYYGLQILNRNDPEPFYVGITPSDDIELSDAFLIYRARAGMDAENAIYGFWIFEPSQLEQIGKTILSLQEAPYPPEPVELAPPSESHGVVETASIGLDALFGSEDNKPAPVFTEQEKAGASILNALFKEASEKEAPDGDAQQAPAAEPPPTKKEAAPPANETKAPAQGAAVGPARSVTTGESIDLEALFSGASVQDADPTSMEPVDHLRAPAEEQETPPKTESSHSDSARDATPSAARLAHAVPTSPLLSRADFVQKLIVQLCTNQSYVDQLYAEYIAQAQ